MTIAFTLCAHHFFFSPSRKEGKQYIFRTTSSPVNARRHNPTLHMMLPRRHALPITIAFTLLTHHFLPPLRK